MVLQDVPQLQLAAEAPARAGGGAGLQHWLGKLAQEGAAPGCEPADGGRAPEGPSAALRARAECRQSCATVKNEDASGSRLQPPALRAGGGLPGAE